MQQTRLLATKVSCRRRSIKVTRNAHFEGRNASPGLQAPRSLLSKVHVLKKMERL